MTKALNSRCNVLSQKYVQDAINFVNGCYVDHVSDNGVADLLGVLTEGIKVFERGNRAP